MTRQRKASTTFQLRERLKTLSARIFSRGGRRPMITFNQESFLLTYSQALSIRNTIRVDTICFRPTV